MLHSSIWLLAKAQHGVVTRTQLLAAGISHAAIRHRVSTGRLHLKARGVYAVGSPWLSRHGEWMVAILACGPGAVLSHESAAWLWGMRFGEGDLVDVTVPRQVRRRTAGVRTVRRDLPTELVTERFGVPVTSPAVTLVDLAARLERDPLEAAVNEADKLDLIDPQGLRVALERFGGWRGAPALRAILDRRTFTLTDSELERRFMPLARRAGLARPLTRRLVNGFRVDFFWPELGLVVETDGLRYHRTPSQQARDRVRDQAHTAAGLTPLRFTRAQVAFEQRHVVGTLKAVRRRLEGARVNSGRLRRL